LLKVILGRRLDGHRGLLDAGVVLVDEPLDRHHALVLAGADDADALGVAPDRRDLRDAGADDLALARHEHDLVVGLRPPASRPPAVAALTLIVMMPLPPRFWTL
jgi:hypothetical protein